MLDLLHTRKTKRLLESIVTILLCICMLSVPVGAAPQPAPTPANLSRLSAARAAASFEEPDGDGHIASHAIDGNTRTRWSNDHQANKTNSWIYVDLGNIYTITKVVLNWEAAYAKEYKLQISDTPADANSWRDVYATSSGGGMIETINMPKNTNTRAMRMQGITPANNYGYSLWEFELWGYEVQPVQSVALDLDENSYTASTSNSSAKFAFDGDDKTFWSADASENDWIQVDLGEVYLLDKFVLKWGANYATKYKIQVSEDGVKWADARDHRSDSAAGAHEDVFDLVSPLAEGRYIRMQGVERKNENGLDLYEFKMYGDVRPPDPAPEWAKGAEISILNITESSVTFSWPAATDNKGVIRYEAYLGNRFVKQAEPGVALTGSVDGLSKGKSYSLKVIALDADDNKTVLNRTFTTIGNPVTNAISYDYPRVYSSGLNNNDWSNGLLAGNGKLGIIVFGNPLKETVIFNDKYLWDARQESSPTRTVNTITAAQVEEIRNLLLTGKYVEANNKAGDASGWKDGGERSKHVGYQMTISMTKNGEICNYSRSTDYTTGVISVNWTDDLGDWERTAFVSRPDDVTVQRLSAPQGKKMSCKVELGINNDMGISNYTRTYGSDIDNINIRMKYPGARYNAGYEGVTRVVTDGLKTITNGVASIENATYVLLLSRTERYNGTYAEGGVPAEQEWNRMKIQSDLANLEADYEVLLQNQIDVHGEIYNRVKIDFGASEEDRAKSNEELLALQKNSNIPVPALFERAFYAGRYHMLSSSGAQQTPDLLGNWTGNTSAGWGGYYHLDANLNLQISGGNIGDMPEAMEGFFYMMKMWQEDFRTNAKTLLGGNRGMLTAGNTPITDGIISSIGRDYPYQYVTGGVSWLLYPMWEHYLITGDEDFLRDQYYPLVRDMGDFYEDFLVEKDENGNYIFAGSISPENAPRGYRPLSVNSVYDIAGARFALETLMETCEVLGKDSGDDKTLIPIWQEILDHLPPYLINEDNALAEWAWPDFVNLDDYGHRHSSQMMPIWPYREVTPETDPEIYAAARETLARKDRGGYGGHGHGVLHGALNAANLHNADSVSEKLVRLLKNNYYYDSLATSHDPNYGASYCTDVANAVPTIMMEMLALTNRGTVDLLPAVPSTLTKGSVTGMKGRGQLTLDEITWDLNAGTIDVKITSDTDQNLTLIQRSGIKEIAGTGTVIKDSQLGSIARVLELKAGEQASLSLKIGTASEDNSLTRGKAATASGMADEEHTARKAIDGDITTSWVAGREENAWLQVDLGDKYVINQVVLNWAESYAKGYKVQTSVSGNDWEDIYIQANSNGGVEIIPLEATTRYIRIQSTEKSSTGAISLKEFDVYGEILQNIALNKPAYASSSAKREDQYPFAAVDGNLNTRWASESLDRQWIYIDLKDTYDLTGAKIAWEDSYGKRYKLQIADANPEAESSWKDIDTAYVDNDCPGGNIEHKLSATGRYVRMQGLERSNQFGFSIWEFEIYGTPTQAVPSRKIVSFDTELSGLTVTNGTKQSDLPLPGKLPVLLSDGSEEVLPLQWENVSVPAYAGDIAGEYLFSAILLLPEDGSITKDDSMDLCVTVLVTVKEAETHVESLKITQTGIPTVSKGKKLQLDVIINPEDVANPGITWESSNPLVLTIDGNGLVTGVKAGTARVTVKAANGVSISIAVRVM